MERGLGGSSSFRGSMVGMAGDCSGSGGRSSTVGLTGVMVSKFTSLVSAIFNNIDHPLEVGRDEDYMYSKVLWSI